MSRLPLHFPKPGQVFSTYVDAQERRLLIQSVVVGVLVWVFVYLLKLALGATFDFVLLEIDRGPSAWLFLVPLVLGALATAWVTHSTRSQVHYRDADGHIHALNSVEGDGLERAIALYFASEPTPERMLLGEQGVQARWRLPTFSLVMRKMVATWLTLASGGSGGLEGSVALVGESVAAGLFKPRPAMNVGKGRHGTLERWWHWWRATQPDDLQAAQVCGIAAAIATLLGTPFAAAFFAIEVMYRRRPIVNRLIYALVSALVAFFLSHLVTGGHPVFIRPSVDPPVYDGRYYVALLAVVVTVSVLAVQFRRSRTWADDFFHQKFANPWVRHVVGAVLTALAAIAVLFAAKWIAPHEAIGAGAEGLRLVGGTGERMIDMALIGKLGAGVAVFALAGRMFATLATITSGGSAGLLYPTLCFGALTASAWASFFHFPAPVLVVPAMAASMVSIANVPLAAIMLVVEAFGTTYMVPSLFMVVVATILAHENSIYRAQRRTFDDRQVLPGVSVRRVAVPEGWEGRSLRDVGVRQKHGLTVIGMIDRSMATDGTLDERIVFNPRADQALTESDVLIVLGEDAVLDRFEMNVHHVREVEVPPAANVHPSNPLG